MITVDILNSRKRKAQAIFDHCHKHSLSPLKAAEALGLNTGCFYSTVKDWRKNRIAEELKEEARIIIDMLLLLNKKFTINAGILTWQDVERGSSGPGAPAMPDGEARTNGVYFRTSLVEREEILSFFKPRGNVSAQLRSLVLSHVREDAATLPLFQKQGNKNIALVQQLTGKTEQEITEEAIAMYCKAILQDYVSTL